MNLKLLLSAAALASIAILVACGGNVVVDGGSSTTVGAGAGTSSSSSGLAGSTGTFGGGGGTLGVGSQFCGSPIGFSNPFQCGSTASGGTSCVTSYCGEMSPETWTASCQGNICQCSTQFGGGGEGPAMAVCACALPSGVDACATGTNCCFTTP
jgi:hypothetical protein